MTKPIVVVGAGPAGLLLGHLLHAEGVPCVVVERQTPDYILGRIRAGVLETVTTDLMRRLGIDARLDAEGLVEGGFNLADGHRRVRVDVAALTGRSVTVYGQTELTRDLIAAADERGLPVVYEAKDVALHDLNSSTPFVTFAKDGEERRIDAAFIAGCDGYHGASRKAVVAAGAGREFERVYPFGWLGILADVPPCHDELEARFAPLAERAVTRGPALEMSIAPLRSYVFETMRHGRLLLAGDAAYIVPPTGAKGLNLAASDVAYLSDALIGWHRSGDEAGVLGYAERALARVWKAERFSWSLTKLMHRFPEDGAFERRMQIAELDYLAGSTAMQTAIAENYVGLSLPSGGAR